MDDILTRVPVNGTAAKVISQKGCSDGELTDEQLRENLQLRVKQIEHQLASMPRGSERKKLGKEKAEICLRINAIRPKKKLRGLSKFFVDAAREQLSGPVFNQVMRAAKRKYHEAHALEYDDG